MALSGYPDGQGKSFANQKFIAVAGTTSTQNSTGALLSTNAADFGFGAGLLKIVVDSAGPAYLQMNGQLATTADYRLTSGDLLTDWYNIGVPVSGMSICATSTSIAMRVGAWG